MRLIHTHRVGSEHSLTWDSAARVVNNTHTQPLVLQFTFCITFYFYFFHLRPPPPLYRNTPPLESQSFLLHGGIYVLKSARSRLLGANMHTIEPTAEVPLPFDLMDEQPATHKDALAVAVNTVNIIEELGGALEYNDADLTKAKALLTGEGKPKLPTTLTASAEAKAVTTLVKKFNFPSFADALEARQFITNKLVLLADCGDPKIEIRALELLGKHSDIGLFTERSEVTVHHTTSETLENSIKERIKRLLNADVIDVTPLDDLDTHLGPIEDINE